MREFSRLRHEDALNKGFFDTMFVDLNNQHMKKKKMRKFGGASSINVHNEANSLFSRASGGGHQRTMHEIQNAGEELNEDIDPNYYPFRTKWCNINTNR